MKPITDLEKKYIDGLNKVGKLMCAKCTSEITIEIGTLYFHVNPCKVCEENTAEEANSKGFDEGFEQGEELVDANHSYLKGYSDGWEFRKRLKK